MANFVIFITLASLMAAAYASPISFDSVTFYIVGFQVWTSVSLVIDTTIAGIMIWSVCNQSSDQPIPLLTSNLS